MIKWQSNKFIYKGKYFTIVNSSHFNKNFPTYILNFFLIIVKMPTRIIWGDPETDLLVRERRRRNNEYHTRFRGNKVEFWQSVVGRLQRRYNVPYTARKYEQ